MKAKVIILGLGLLVFFLIPAEISAKDKRGSKKNKREKVYKKSRKSKHTYKQNRYKKNKHTKKHKNYSYKNHPYHPYYGVLSPHAKRKIHRHYPHFGLKVSVLPSVAFRMNYRNKAYFYADGFYYCSYRGGRLYEVVRPPRGLCVACLPNDARWIQMNRKMYLEFNNTLYKEVMISGRLMYKVVGYL